MAIKRADMQEPKKEVSHPDFVKWFSELNKTSGKFAGGKGANLAEIYNLKIPVPPGFVVTAQAYDYFLEKAGLKKQIMEMLAEIDFENTKQLEDVTKQIRKMIVDAKIPKEMEEEILEAYDNLDTSGLDVERGSVLNILNQTDPIFVAVRSSATAEDLADASFAGQQDSFVNVKGNQELIRHVKMCFASLFTARATYYRNKKGFEHSKVSLAVVVQKMVDSDKSGVIFSQDPSYKNDNIVIEAVWGLGEGIVSGAVTPDKYVLNREFDILDRKISEKKIAITRDSAGVKTVVKLREEKAHAQVLKPYEIKKLAEFAINLEEHYQKPQDIEFAIEGEEIFLVQTRPITTIANRVSSESKKELKGEVILTGLAASPGIGVGKIKIVNDLKDLNKIKTGDVLVTKMTNPDMVVTMQKAAAIVTDEGGMTAHAAIVSREMGIPCIVGTEEATTKLKEGEIITVDGFAGKVYKGKVSESVQKEIMPVTATTKTKIKVIVDLPTFAERSAKTELKQIGLTRIEGIIAESGKHPRYFLKQNKIKDYEDIIFRGIKGISRYFEEMWVRTSDIRTDEFENLEGAPSEVEANPMLGMHGIRYGIKNPEILKAELNALKRVADEGKCKVGVMMPQVILLEELQFVKKMLQEIDFKNAKVGVMIETPAAVQLIKDFCEDGIDFISFGTNDLTQYILAVDRGNEEVQNLYNEMHPAVLHQIEFVIRVCKRYKVESSICGQAGSKKEMAKFLVEKGIDSISVNADVAAEIAEYIAEVESELTKGTDKEPRQYQPKKDEDKLEEDKVNEEQPDEKEELVSELVVEETEEQVEEYDEPVKESENEEPVIEPTYAPDEEVYEKPQINGAEYLGVSEEGIEDAVEAIEEEKQDYLEEHPEETESVEEIPEPAPEEFKDDEIEEFDEESLEKHKNNEDEVLDIF